MSEYTFDWSDVAFGSKKSLHELKATFILAPREMSPKRFTQIVKQYLPAGNILLGLSKEEYVMGLEGQPQFKTLKARTVQSLIDKVNKSPVSHKIYTLRHSQRDTRFIFEKVKLKKVLLINGSWYTSFHTRPEYYALTTNDTSYEMLSPFTDETEARAYAQTTKLADVPATGHYTAQEMLELAARAARRSYDTSFQTGVAVGRKKGSKYELLLTAHNQVVPYETYAMHFGASREKNFSPPNDLNYYDAIHAEMLAVIKAQQQGIDLTGATLFINLLPCPTCSRALALTGLAEFVYSADHSDGYAIVLFEQCGKKVRRIVPAQTISYNKGEERL